MWASLFRKKTIDKIISDQLEMEKLAGHSMIRNLGVRDLTFMGVAAIIGASIFSAIGQACTLQYINAKWFCIGNNGAAFA
jgi:TPP-dependent pyruvate/acetoin dehydrogenase alpha subunit